MPSSLGEPLPALLAEHVGQGSTHHGQACRGSGEQHAAIASTTAATTVATAAAAVALLSAGRKKTCRVAP